ncbi:MAG: hypothetical protein MZV65_44935 [Chromatiales bacterium]|nr:hypothetical protein [Chromatiales bacterium]
MTPSHNPPEDGGFKYNPPHGGPADTDVTGRIEERANALLAGGNCAACSGMPYAQRAPRRRPPARTTTSTPYVDDLGARRRPGGDPRRRRCASASTRWAAPAVAYWAPIAERYGLDLDGRQPARRPDLRAS